LELRLLARDSLAFLGYFRARWARRIDVRALGPNEARVLYDAGVAVFGAAATLAFHAAYLHSSGGSVIALVLLPLLSIVSNAVVGVYSRFRTSAGSRKALALLAATLIAAAVAVAFGAALAEATLWVLLVYPPLALARLLLELPYTRHPGLIATAVNRRGPVLVIGGAGYIGSHVVDLLLRDGQRVRVLDRLMYGNNSLADFSRDPNFELIEGDATDIAKLTEAMKGASAVVHLAGLVGDPACAIDPDFTRHTNIVATKMTKLVAQSLGVHRFIFASSCSVYGVTPDEVSETGPLRPVSVYAQTKIDSENELLNAVPDNFFVCILRFATVFGDSRRPRFDLVANLFTAQAMTDGLITVIGPNQRRPFIHVRDVARAIVMALKANPVLIQSQIFNVGDARLNMTIQQLADRVRAVCGRYGEVSISVTQDPQDRRTYAVSFHKIRSMLGFEASMLMEPGIEEMAAAFRGGKYGDHRAQAYNNAAITSKAAAQFHDPAELARLYAPLKTN
jgi:nucleoside-diphosphate-sugar epimerase